MCEDAAVKRKLKDKVLFFASRGQLRGGAGSGIGCLERAMTTEAPAETMDTTDIFGDGDAGEDLGEEIARAEPDEIAQRTRMLENEIKVLRNETSRLLHEQQTQKEKIKENGEKIKLNKQLPFLVANVVELLDMDPEDEPEEVCACPA